MLRCVVKRTPEPQDDKDYNNKNIRYNLSVISEVTVLARRSINILFIDFLTVLSKDISSLLFFVGKIIFKSYHAIALFEEMNIIIRVDEKLAKAYLPCELHALHPTLEL